MARSHSPLHLAPRRLLGLSALAALLGVAGGVAAWLLLHLISGVTSVALFHRFSWDHPTLAHVQRGPALLAAAVAGALAVSLLALWCPIIKGHGIPEAMEAVVQRQSRISPKAAFAKPVSAALAIGTGAPFGAEGPIIVTGGAIGSLIGQVLPVSASERKVLLAAGAAAGMAATFGAPLAAVLLAVELLLFEFSTRAIVPIAVAAAVAGGMHVALFGGDALFPAPTATFGSTRALVVFAALGLICGVLAAVVARGLFLVERLYRRLPINDFWHPVVGAVGFVAVGLVVPRALGVGYDVIGDVLTGKLALGTLTVLAIAKLLAWWIALGSGTSGGTLAPLLMIGGCVGGALGVGLGNVWPGSGVSAPALALVAMAALFGASTWAPLTAVVFLVELTHAQSAIVPLLVATMVARLVTGTLLHESLMTEKLARRGLRLHWDYQADALAATRVADVMTTTPSTLPARTTVGEARLRLLNADHATYPLVTREGRCTGLLSTRSLLLTDLPDSAPLDDLTHPAVVVPAHASALDALDLLLDQDADALIVTGEHGRLAGLVTRTDVLAARRRQRHLDLPEPGWRPTRRRQGSGATAVATTNGGQ